MIDPPRHAMSERNEPTRSERVFDASKHHTEHRLKLHIKQAKELHITQPNELHITHAKELKIKHNKPNIYKKKRKDGPKNPARRNARCRREVRRVALKC